MIRAIQYECRRCHTRFSPGSVPARWTPVIMPHKGYVEFPQSDHPRSDRARLCENHRCTDGGNGVADLVGFGPPSST